MTRRLLIGSGIVMAAALTWLAWNGWTYLRAGYSLALSMPGRPPAVSHIDFPAWRAMVHILLWLATLIGAVAYATGRRWASLATWSVVAAIVLVGISDVVRYGFIGSPTSVWTVLLVLLLALLTSFGSVAPSTRV